MRELSLHIMDIIENGINAGADLIELSILEDRRRNRLEIKIRDNGRGIPGDLLDKVTDPFFTTRTTRRVGLGLSLFREASRRCEGEFNIRPGKERGTEVSASFRMDHIDLAPMGNLAGAVTTLIMGNPDVDFLYSHSAEEDGFVLDTRDVRKELGGVPLNHPEVLNSIDAAVRQGLAALKEKGA